MCVCVSVCVCEMGVVGVKVIQESGRGNMAVYVCECVSPVCLCECTGEVY